MEKRKTFTLVEIVQQLGGELLGDTGVRIRQVAPIQTAVAGDISFLAQQRYIDQLQSTQASAVILGQAAQHSTALPRIVCANPYAYYAGVVGILNPPFKPEAGVHNTAVVADGAHIAETASVGP